MTISRMQQPRQLYGLGSLVKSVTKGIKGAVKGVKDFVKSDFGKAAGLAALTFGVPYTKFGGLLGRKSLFDAAPSIFGIEGGIGPSLAAAQEKLGLDVAKGDKPSFGQTLGVFGLGTAAFTALAAAGLDPDNPNEMPRDVESLRGYLKSGYMKLNPDSSPREAEQFAIQNTSEYATGGRVGLAEGTEKGGIQSIIIPKRKSDAFMTEEELEATSPGLARGEVGDPMPGRLESAKRLRGVMQLYDRLKNMAESGEMSNKEEAMALFNQRMKEEAEKLHFLDKEKLEDYIRENRAYGGRMQYAMGSPEENAVQAAGIMDLPLNQNKAGVTELDLRETGGFIPPVGVKEKADDIPAMLSNNEFVFTADAVRGMGNGDVNVGAQRMYDMMKKLENGGRIA